MGALWLWTTAGCTRNVGLKAHTRSWCSISDSKRLSPGQERLPEHRRRGSSDDCQGADFDEEPTWLQATDLFDHDVVRVCACRELGIQVEVVVEFASQISDKSVG